MSTKILHKQSTEDLLKTLEDDSILDESPTDRYENEMLRFISEYKLEPGDSKVPVQILLELYNRYNIQAVNRHTLTVRLKKYMPFENGHFLLNMSAIELSQTYYDILASKYRDMSKSTVAQTRFKKFLNDKNIKNGHTFVPWYFIYYQFLIWCRDTKFNTIFLSPLEFRRLLRNQFDEKRLTESTPWFGIDETDLEKELDESEAIEEWHQKEKIKKKGAKYRLPSPEPKEEHQESSEAT